MRSVSASDFLRRRRRSRSERDWNWCYSKSHEDVIGIGAGRKMSERCLVKCSEIDLDPWHEEEKGREGFYIEWVGMVGENSGNVETK